MIMKGGRATYLALLKNASGNYKPQFRIRTCLNFSRSTPLSPCGRGLGGGGNFKTSIQKFWKESIKKVNTPHPNPLPQWERELIEIGLMPYPELALKICYKHQLLTSFISNSISELIPPLFSKYS